MQNNQRITHFRVIKNTDKKVLKEAMKAIIAGQANPSDYPIFTDTHHARVSGLELAAKGGVTVVSDESTGDTALAVCGLKEHFCRRKGRDIATGRLTKKSRELVH